MSAFLIKLPSITLIHKKQISIFYYEICNYRDEIGVILVNLSNEPYTVEDGERIAQFVLSSVDKVLKIGRGYRIHRIENKKKEDRGGGYGHSDRF